MASVTMTSPGKNGWHPPKRFGTVRKLRAGEMGTGNHPESSNLGVSSSTHLIGHLLHEAVPGHCLGRNSSLPLNPAALPCAFLRPQAVSHHWFMVI